MPGFSSYQEIVAAQNAGQTRTYYFYKTLPSTPEAGSTWINLWRGGVVPGTGATVPSVPGTTYTNSSTSITFPDTSPAKKFITRVGIGATSGMTLMVYDRLFGVGTLPLNTTRVINGATVPRYNGEGVHAWATLEGVPGGNAAGTLVSYTNQDGVSGRVGSQLTLTEVVNPDADTFFGPFPLAAGDTGIRSVQTWAGNTPITSATVNLVLLRPLLYLPYFASTGWLEVDFVLQNMLLPRVYDGASLCLAVQPHSAVISTVWGTIEVTWA